MNAKIARMSENIKKPVIIIGCPRSGTTLLFTILTQSPELYSLYRESWNVYREGYKQGLLNPDAEDDVIPESAATKELIELFRDEFHKYSVNNEALAFWTANHYRLRFLSAHMPVPNLLAPVFKSINAMSKKEDYRLLEKTPRNCFRVGFMNKIFPDAKFVFISRDAKSNISSLIEGWKRNAGRIKHQRYPEINTEFNFNNFDYAKWEYVLPPEWKQYNGKSLEETCANQWVKSNEYALEGLSKIESERVMKIKYEDLTANGGETVKSICNFIEIDYSGKIKDYAEKPPVVSTGFMDKPREDKWKKNEKAIETVMPMIQPMMQTLGYLEPSPIV